MQTVEIHGSRMEQYKKKKECGCKAGIEDIIDAPGIYYKQTGRYKDIEHPSQYSQKPHIIPQKGEVGKPAEKGNPFLPPFSHRNKVGGYGKPCHQTG